MITINVWLFDWSTATHFPHVLLVMERCLEANQYILLKNELGNYCSRLTLYIIFGNVDSYRGIDLISSISRLSKRTSKYTFCISD